MREAHAWDPNTYRISKCGPFQNPEIDAITLSAIVRDAIDMANNMCYRPLLSPHVTQAAYAITMNILAGYDTYEQQFFGLAGVAYANVVLRYVVEHSYNYKSPLSPDDIALSCCIDTTFQTQHLRGVPIVDYKDSESLVPSTLLLFSRLAQDYSRHINVEDYLAKYQWYLSVMEELIEDRAGTVDYFIDCVSCKYCVTGTGTFKEHDSKLGLDRCVCGHYIMQTNIPDDFLCLENLMDGFNPLDMYMTDQD